MLRLQTATDECYLLNFKQEGVIMMCKLDQKLRCKCCKKYKFIDQHSHTHKKSNYHAIQSQCTHQYLPAGQWTLAL